MTNPDGTSATRPRGSSYVPPAGGYSPAGIIVLLGKGGGAFAAPSFISTDLWPTSVTVGDSDSDGLPDVIATLTNTIQIALLRQMCD